MSTERTGGQIARAEKLLDGERGELVKSPLSEGRMVTINGASVTYTEGKP